jgi:hypothetical protein
MAKRDIEDNFIDHNEHYCQKKNPFTKWYFPTPSHNPTSELKPPRINSYP